MDLTVPARPNSTPLPAPPLNGGFVGSSPGGSSHRRRNGLSTAHRDFLAAGGLGLLIGDGMLNYGNEQILETYYSYSIDKNFTITPTISSSQIRPTSTVDPSPFSQPACTASSRRRL